MAPIVFKLFLSVLYCLIPLETVIMVTRDEELWLRTKLSKAITGILEESADHLTDAGYYSDNMASRMADAAVSVFLHGVEVQEYKDQQEDAK
jgi:hypothetical protein